MNQFEFPVKEYRRPSFTLSGGPGSGHYQGTISWLLSMAALGLIWLLSLVKLVLGLVFMLPWKLWRFAGTCWWTLYWGGVFLLRNDAKMAMAVRRAELREQKSPDSLVELTELVNEFRALGPHGVRNQRHLNKLETLLRQREREWFLDE